MSAPLYAVDNIGVHHTVAYADSLSARVTTLCKHPAFTPAKPLGAKRPDADEFCASCLDVEKRRPQSPAEQPVAAVSGPSTPTPRSAS